MNDTITRTALIMPERIRQARATSGIPQRALAEAVGVQRSAVAQWERRGGSLPSMDHLIAIATITGVCLEWLGTGRGPMKPDDQAWTPATLSDDYALNELESECLAALRAIPFHIRKPLVNVISLAARNFADASHGRRKV